MNIFSSILTIFLLCAFTKATDENKNKKICGDDELAIKTYTDYECIKKQCINDQKLNMTYSCKHSFLCESESTVNITAFTRLMNNYTKHDKEEYLILTINISADTYKSATLNISKSTYHPTNNIKNVKNSYFHFKAEKNCFKVYVTQKIEGPQQIPIDIQIEESGENKRRVFRLNIFVSEENYDNLTHHQKKCAKRFCQHLPCKNWNTNLTPYL